MNWQKMFLAILGVVLILFSFFIEKIFSKRKKNKDIDNRENTEEIQKKNEIELLFEENKKEIESLTSKKISEIEKYTKKVLGKIDVNNNAVMFMYDMLLEKERTIRELLGKFDDNKNKYKKELVIDKKLERDNNNQSIKEDRLQKDDDKILREIDNYDREKKEFLHKNQASAIKLNMKGNIDKKKEENMSLHRKIINLNREGKTPVEISQSMNMGVGEVNLILNLYNE